MRVKQRHSSDSSDTEENLLKGVLQGCVMSPEISGSQGFNVHHSTPKLDITSGMSTQVHAYKNSYQKNKTFSFCGDIMSFQQHTMPQSSTRPVMTPIVIDSASDGLLPAQRQDALHINSDQGTQKTSVLLSKIRTADQEREARLERQKQKKEEFKKSLLRSRRQEYKKQYSSATLENTPVCTTSLVSSVQSDLCDTSHLIASSVVPDVTATARIIPAATKEDIHDLGSVDGSLLNQIDPILVSPIIKPTENNKPVILVASKELAGGQEVVSCLRAQEHVQVVVCQMSCDYIVSSRMAVERKMLSDFANGLNRSKLVEQIRRMCEAFDRVCLILEMKQQKSGKDKNSKMVQRTKYVDSTLVLLSQSQVKVLYSGISHIFVIIFMYKYANTCHRS